MAVSPFDRLGPGRRVVMGKSEFGTGDAYYGPKNN
jgi:hypothetical protein